MQIQVMNHSSYPRVGDPTKLQSLRRIHDQWEKGEKSDEDLRAAEDLAVLEAILDQDRAGVDIATDGLVRWDDPISHLLKGRSGVTLGGLVRYFDSNFYIRRPALGGKEINGASRMREEFVYASALTHTPIKPVVTGPLTLAHHTTWKPPLFETIEAAAEALAKPVAAEVRALAEAGSEFIQIDEPSLAHVDVDAKVYKNILKPVVGAKSKAKLILAVYFGDCTRLLGPLSTLDIDVLCLDFTYSPGLTDEIRATGLRKPLAAGLADGRTTKMESPRQIAERFNQIAGKLRADVGYLVPSCGLEHVPRDAAQRKLDLLAKARAHLRGAAA
ncbi:MAG: hypothetical protein HYY13_10865 [Nitrospirae bacterium]|nr:hypothetical protein [Nitrospirota bacterium]